MTSLERRATRLFDALRLDSIRNRILALAVLATLIPTLATAILSYRQNRRALADTLDSELRSVVSQTAREIDLWVDQRAFEVRVFTGSFEVTENLERIRRGGAVGAVAEGRLTDYLDEVYGRSGDYVGLLVTNAEAAPMESAGEVTVSLDALPDDWLARVGRGESVVGEPYVDPELSEAVATLAVPIEAGPLTFVGALAATLTFDTVAEILADLTLEDGGHVVLVTAGGDVIAESGAPDSAAPGQQDAIPTDVLDLLSASENGSAEYTSPEGADMVGSLAAVPGMEWSVVARIPAEEAYAEIARLRNSALLIVAFILVGVGGVAYLLGLLIVRPLARLTEGAGAVAAGDLSVDLPEVGRGEVGYLIEVFNEMVGRLRESREELDERSRELERLSVTDLLTGLHNRRFLLDAFDEEIRRADRHERPFCVLMIDVDRFKQYNDAHGHLAGDEVLMRMGAVLRDATRDLDVIARYGGEEFVCLLPECDLDNAIRAAERIRSRLAEETFDGGAVTISIGVAEFPTHGETAAAVIGEADAALYAAKAAGRDRVMGAPPKPQEVVREATSQRTASLQRKRGARKKTREEELADKRETAKKTSARKKPAAKSKKKR